MYDHRCELISSKSKVCSVTAFFDSHTFIKTVEEKGVTQIDMLG